MTETTKCIPRESKCMYRQPDVIKLKSDIKSGKRNVEKISFLSEHNKVNLMWDLKHCGIKDKGKAELGKKRLTNSINCVMLSYKIYHPSLHIRKIKNKMNYS